MLLKEKLKGTCQYIRQLASKRKDSIPYQALYSAVNSNPDSFLKATPSLAYGRFRNLASWLMPCHKKLTKIRISLIVEQSEVLHLNHIKIWVRNNEGHIVQYSGGYNCNMSSCAEVLPDPNLVLQGNENNTVSIHSKREVKPWWEVSFTETQTVEYIQVFNRKDSFGQRYFSSYIQGFDEKGHRVYEQNRVQKKNKLALLNDELLYGLDSIQAYYEKTKAVKPLEVLFFAIKNHAFQNSQASEQQLKAEIVNMFDALNLKTPDVGLNKKSAVCLLPDSQTRYVRVLSFRKRQPRKAEICIAVNDEDSVTISECDRSDANEYLLELKQRYKHLPTPHVFQLELTEQNVENVAVWAEDNYSADLLVLRQIQVSNDGMNWQTLDSSLEPFAAALTLLQTYEFFFADNWTSQYIQRMGIFFGVYRMHLARAFKGLVSSVNRNLLLSYYQGIENGGCRSNHLPSVVYTRHGLSVPFSEQSSEFIADRMNAFCQTLEEKLGLKAFPCYGTLLGIYRDNDFLPHDDDVDLAVVVDLPDGFTYRERTEYWIKRLAEIGIKAAPPTPTSLNLHCYYEDFDMDLFFIYPSKSNKKSLWTHMEGYKVRNVDKNMLLPLGMVSFLGHDFYAPNDIEAFLKDRYGKTWGTPDPYFEL